jgi:hypothetical protein
MSERPAGDGGRGDEQCKTRPNGCHDEIPLFADP